MDRLTALREILRPDANLALWPDALVDRYDDLALEAERLALRMGAGEEVDGEVDALVGALVALVDAAAFG